MEALGRPRGGKRDGYRITKSRTAWVTAEEPRKNREHRRWSHHKKGRLQTGKKEFENPILKVDKRLRTRARGSGVMPWRKERIGGRNQEGGNLSLGKASGVDGGSTGEEARYHDIVYETPD